MMPHASDSPSRPTVDGVLLDAGAVLLRVGSGGMAADSMVQLVSCLTAQQPYGILGTPESEWVDFKSISPKGP
jgi:hypothetical protein